MSINKTEGATPTNATPWLAITPKQAVATTEAKLMQGVAANPPKPSANGIVQDVAKIPSTNEMIALLKKELETLLAAPEDKLNIPQIFATAVSLAISQDAEGDLLGKAGSIGVAVLLAFCSEYPFEQDPISAPFVDKVTKMGDKIESELKVAIANAKQKIADIKALPQEKQNDRKLALALHHLAQLYDSGAYFFDYEDPFIPLRTAREALDIVVNRLNVKATGMDAELDQVTRTAFDIVRKYQQMKEAHQQMKNVLMSIAKMRPTAYTPPPSIERN